MFRASRFVRDYARTREPITVDVIYHIHKIIFEEAWPEIAGVIRHENISRITGSDHIPPPHQHVAELMEKVDARMAEYTTSLEEASANGWISETGNESEERLHIMAEVLNFAAYVHHTITYIHPFREGNGRTARLAANLVLERYGLPGISIKIERENKNRYCNALAQIDKHEDYEPLLDLIAEGIIERVNGALLKLRKQ